MLQAALQPTLASMVNAMAGLTTSSSFDPNTLNVISTAASLAQPANRPLFSSAAASSIYNVADAALKQMTSANVPASIKTTALVNQGFSLVSNTLALQKMSMGGIALLGRRLQAISPADTAALVQATRMVDNVLQLAVGDMLVGEPAVTLTSDLVSAGVYLHACTLSLHDYMVTMSKAVSCMQATTIPMCCLMHNHQTCRLCIT